MVVVVGETTHFRSAIPAPFTNLNFTWFVREPGGASVTLLSVPFLPHCVPSLRGEISIYRSCIFRTMKRKQREWQSHGSLEETNRHLAKTEVPYFSFVNESVGVRRGAGVKMVRPEF